MAKSKSGSNTIGRDARSGQFIPVSEALRRPSTTVIETRNPPPKNTGGKTKKQ